MSETNFWDRIKYGCEKLDIPMTTYHVWKHRGRVSRDQAIPLYQVLAGTKYEISLDQLQNN